jgi:hypothetical protein
LERMVTLRVPTTMRFTEDDQKVLEKLQKVTGLDSAAAVIRLAIRESLAAREKKRRK